MLQVVRHRHVQTSAWLHTSKSPRLTPLRILKKKIVPSLCQSTLMGLFSMVGPLSYSSGRHLTMKIHYPQPFLISTLQKHPNKKLGGGKKLPSGRNSLDPLPPLASGPSLSSIRGPSNSSTGSKVHVANVTPAFSLQFH